MLFDFWYSNIEKERANFLFQIAYGALLYLTDFLTFTSQF